MSKLVGAIDQGTTSTRFIVFDEDGRPVCSAQKEHRQILPRPGWVEHDADEIWSNTVVVIDEALAAGGLAATDLAAIGITNQRETTVAWDTSSGRPLAKAIVWQDTRTADDMAAMDADHRGELIRQRTGLLPSTYFAGGKMRWLSMNEESVASAAARDTLRLGTIDSWLLWNLTGGEHVTDVTNASRTMLMDLRTLDWDEELLSVFELRRSWLPQIRPSSDAALYGNAERFGGVALGAALGDQHAALLGQTCTRAGEAKNTYGTGNFLLQNTGTEIVRSQHGLLSTVSFQLGDDTQYAVEGSVAVTGSAVQWLRDQLGVIGDATESETLAAQVPDSGGLYFVPAFSGLFAPHWRPDARGVIVGMSRFNTKAHLARATLEAICFQSRDVIDAMAADSGVPLPELRVDGGASTNDLCMQIQADVLGVPVRRPVVTETTALGAAYAAGLAVGVWDGVDDLRSHWRADRSWEPEWSDDERESRYAMWRKAVERTLDWV